MLLRKQLDEPEGRLFGLFSDARCLRFGRRFRYRAEWLFVSGTTPEQGSVNASVLESPEFRLSSRADPALCSESHFCLFRHG